MSTQVTNEKLAADLKAVMKDAEILIKDTSEVLGEKAAVARQKLEVTIRDAKARLIESAKATNEFVQENPWKAVGIAAGVGFLAGYLLGKRR